MSNMRKEMKAPEMSCCKAPIEPKPDTRIRDDTKLIDFGCSRHPVTRLQQWGRLKFDLAAMECSVAAWPKLSE